MMRLFHYVHKYQQVAKKSLAAISDRFACSDRSACEVNIPIRYQKYSTYTSDDTETDQEYEVVRGTYARLEKSEPLSVFYCKKEQKGIRHPYLINIYEQFYDNENEQYVVVSQHVTARQQLRNYLNDAGVGEILYTRYTNFVRISPVFQSWLRQALIVSCHLKKSGVTFRPTLENAYVVVATDGSANLRFNSVMDDLNDDEVEKDCVVYYAMRFAEEILRNFGIKPTFNITHLRIRAEKGDKWWVDIQDIFENPLFWSVNEEQGFIVDLGTYIRKSPVANDLKRPDSHIPEVFRTQLYDHLEKLAYSGLPNLTKEPWSYNMKKEDFGTKFDSRSDLMIFASLIISHEDEHGSRDVTKMEKVDKIKGNWDNDPALLPTCLNEKFGWLQAAFFVCRKLQFFSWRLPSSRTTK